MALLSLIVPALLGSAAPATAVGDFPDPKPGAPWFGPELDWEEGVVARYTNRLGSPVSLISRPVDYPLTQDSRGALRNLALRAEEMGAISVVSLQPVVPLDALDSEDATHLVLRLNELTDELGSAFLLRLAPEMNGSWVSYGQQPTAYVEAFQDFAEVVHSQGEAAQTVWAPAYGAGYPFGGSINDTVRGSVDSNAPSPRDRKLLDTNRNGRLDDRDDPYGPYFPGSRAADWVGLSMLRYGVNQRFGANTVPARRELNLLLNDEFGYPDTVTRPSFYRRYAQDEKKPMLLLTAALFNPAAEADKPTERTIKVKWLKRIATAARTRPQIKAVVWLESTRREPEVGGQVRWGLTPTPSMGRALGQRVVDGPFELGPVLAPPRETPGSAPTEGATSEADPPPAQDEESGNVLTEAVESTGLSGVALSLLVGGGLLIVAAGAFLRFRRRQLRPPWL